MCYCWWPLYGFSQISQNTLVALGPVGTTKPARIDIIYMKLEGHLLGFARNSQWRLPVKLRVLNETVNTHFRVSETLREPHHKHQVSLDHSDAGQMLAVFCHFLLLLVLLLLLFVLYPLDILLWERLIHRRVFWVWLQAGKRNTGKMDELSVSIPSLCYHEDLADASPFYTQDTARFHLCGCGANRSGRSDSHRCTGRSWHRRSPAVPCTGGTPWGRPSCQGCGTSYGAARLQIEAKQNRPVGKQHKNRFKITNGDAKVSLFPGYVTSSFQMTPQTVSTSFFLFFLHALHRWRHSAPDLEPVAKNKSVTFCWTIIRIQLYKSRRHAIHENYTNTRCKFHCQMTHFWTRTAQRPIWTPAKPNTRVKKSDSRTLKYISKWGRMTCLSVILKSKTF